MAVRNSTCNRCGAVKKDGKCLCGQHKVIGARKKVSNSEKMLKTYKWQKKRESILKRDGGYCQRCWHIDKKLVSDGLEVHHIKNRIDYPDLAWEDSNLICICGSCNKYYRGVDELDFDWNIPEIEYIF